MLPFLIFGEGTYTFGVYAGPDHQPDQALASFQLPIILDAPGQLPQGRGRRNRTFSFGIVRWRSAAPTGAQGALSRPR
jgi:hypothetical protein